MFLLVEGLWDDLTLVSGILYESLCVVAPGRTGRLRRRPSDERGHGPFSERRRSDRRGPRLSCMNCHTHLSVYITLRS